MEQNSIPKILHYCWFGKNKKSKLVKKCIQSWKKYCSDFEIIEWNETNFDVNICPYVREAYERKKWAFVSDYARHYVLLNYGGIYLDTDVELLRPIDDLLKNKFMGIQRLNKNINSGLMMGSLKSDWFCKKIVDEYNLDNFIVDGKENLRTVCMRATEIMQKYGYERIDKTQKCLDYIIYESKYFDPGTDYNNERDRNLCYSIHHYAASWTPLNYKIKRFIKKMFKKLTINRKKGR